MAGVGLFSRPMRLISRSQPTSRKTASAVMCPQKRTIGFTSRAIPLSIPSERRNIIVDPPARRGHMREVKMRRQPYLAVTLSGLAAIGASVALFRTTPVVAQAQRSAAVFTSDGKLQLPAADRGWFSVAAPLTPTGLNTGKANSPKYHHVYFEAQTVDAYLKTGSFPKGPVFVKELTRLLDPTFPDGSRTEPSGRG